MNWRASIGEGGKFISFAAGPFTGKFLGGEETKNKWGDCVKLKFKDQEGNEKTYDTKSKRLLSKLASVPEGSIVKISRYGEGMETNYEVEVVTTAAKAIVDELSKEKSTETISEDAITWDD